MALDPTIRSSLALPAFCAPMTLVSGPDLAREAAKAGIVAGIPRHNARSREEFEGWLKAIRSDLDRFAGENPGAPIGPLAVNLAGSLPLDETMAELAMFARYGVKIIVS
ncbi:MAG: Nitronate monooxygenase, partial [Caulobacteraceae bacterium]|nr:Nitronate monooxygenase [Caulobacteraceae bacterium]